MAWLFSRWLADALLTGIGALIGGLIGAAWHWPASGALIGAALGALLRSFIDAWRAHRFMRWLRLQSEGPAPRVAGLWREVGYRVERSIRLLEQRVDAERKRLDQFLSAIEASPNGVLLLDANDQIEWCNSVAAEHFGLDSQRDRRQRVTNLVRAPAFVNCLQSGRFEEPVLVVARSGPGETLSVLVRPYGQGQKLVLSQDITGRERSEAMRRDFVANVSHEIRTPLTVLSGCIETMAHVPLGAAQHERMLELMSQQAARMQALVADLLTLAQLEGSPRPASDQWVSLHNLFAEVRAQAEALSAGQHQLGFSADTTTLIAGSHAELLSALANLVSNAVRYTPPGGYINVKWTWRADGSGQIEVHDSGIGIAREHLPRLTERFYRVDRSRSRDTGGTGLGLSIVKHVAHRHGGELEIDSEPGKGSSFKLVFPAMRIKLQSADAAAIEPEDREGVKAESRDGKSR